MSGKRNPLARLGGWLRARLGWLTLLALLAGAGAGAVWFRGRQAALAAQQAQAALRTAVVARGAVRVGVSATGSLLPARQISLTFLQSGAVTEVAVQPGDAVHAGQVLARLDDADARLAVSRAEDALAIQQLTLEKLQAGPDSQEVAVAEANVRAAQSSLADLQVGARPQEAQIARLQYDDALKSLDDARQNLWDLQHATLPNGQPLPVPEVTLQLADLSVRTANAAAELARLQWQQAGAGAGAPALAVAGRQIEQAEAQAARTRAGPTEFRFSVARARAAIDQAQLALDLVRLTLERTALLAPFDGVVGEVNLQVGEPAPAALPALTLLDTSSFHLDLAVDEADVARISEGQALSLSLDALPDAGLTGKVARIAPLASVTGGVVTYAVRVSLDPTEAPLLAGMSATAEIVVAEVQDALLIPNWALRRDRTTGEILASLQRGAELMEVPVTLGLRGDQTSQVLSGLQEGEVAAVSLQREQVDLFGGGQ